MSQPIITTDISQIRPVFADGAGENIKRYTQLKKMFQNGKDYAVLAEPMLDGPKKITWHTEFEGAPAPFSKLTEDEQIAAKGRIKYQINKLYKAAFHQLYHNSMNDVKDIFQVLDSCIEIPDYDNIYRIQRPDGKCNYVLIKWGFISDDFNAPSGLIKKLVPTKVDTIKLKVIKNSKTAANEHITIVYNGREANVTTDNKGFIYLEDIPLGDNFEAYAGDKSTTTQYMCDGRDEYHFLIGTSSVDMHFFVTDASGQPMANTDVTFTYDGRTYFEVTDESGRILLRDIAEGTEVVVKQRNATQSFVCDINTQEYHFQSSRPVAEIDVAVIADNGNPIPGVDVKFSYNGKDISVSTDRNGRVSIDNMPIDTDFDIQCTSNQYLTSYSKLHTHEGLNMTEIKIRKVSQSGCMNIRVVDNENNPIVNTLIRCEYDDTKVEFYTNDNGEIALNPVNYNSNVVCTQIINGLGSHRHTFTFVADKNDYVLKCMKILSNATDIEIHVINKKKENVPNLRVTIDDGHNVINRVTDQQGRIHLKGMERDKKYSISTEYSGKQTDLVFVPTKQTETLTIQVGRKSIGLFLWLIPLLALLFWLIITILIPKIKEYWNTPIIIVDTVATSTEDTTTILPPEPEPLKGLNLTILDDKLNQPIANAKVNIEYGKTKFEGLTDSLGKIAFQEVPMDSTLQVKVIVTADGHKDYVSSFFYQTEKTLLITEKSLDLRDIPIDCGNTIKSDGYTSTIQTVNLKQPKGKVTIGYCMHSIPDEMIVYTGKASEISDDKIIWRTDGFVNGPFKKVSINYDTPDGIITVRINGGDDSKTQWYATIYCPVAPKKTNTTKTNK